MALHWYEQGIWWLIPCLEYCHLFNVRETHRCWQYWCVHKCCIGILANRVHTKQSVFELIVLHMCCSDAHYTSKLGANLCSILLHSVYHGRWAWKCCPTERTTSAKTARHLRWLLVARKKMMWTSPLDFLRYHGFMYICFSNCKPRRTPAHYTQSPCGQTWPVELVGYKLMTDVNTLYTDPRPGSGWLGRLPLQPFLLNLIILFEDSKVLDTIWWNSANNGNMIHQLRPQTSLAPWMVTIA